MTEDTRPDARRIADALADLFDTVPPADRAAAEEELRAAGSDPSALGYRAARAADEALAARGIVRRDTQRAPARRVDHGRRGPAPRQPRKWPAILPMGAALVVAVALGWLFGSRPRPERIAGCAPLPGGTWTLPRRPPAPALDQPRYGEGSEAVAARMATPAGGSQRAIDPTPAAQGGIQPDISSDSVGRAGPPDQVGEEPTEFEAPAAGGMAAGQAWILDHRNWQRAEDLLPPPVLQRVKSGEYHFTVQPMEGGALARQFSSDFRAASRDNPGRYDINADNCALRQVHSGLTPAAFFGFPFPAIDRQSPTAACEIVWNVEAAKGLGGGQEATLTLHELEKDSTDRRVELWLRSTAYLGQPSPLHNPDGARSGQIVHAMAPADLAGIASLTSRWNDPNKRDSSWTYVPALRRVRAVSPANRSDGFLGLTLALDDLGCFDGKLEDFTWRVVRTQTVLAPMTGIAPTVLTDLSASRSDVAVPSAKAVFEQTDSSGAPWLVLEDLLMVPRRVWVVEGIPRDPYYLHGRMVMYVDAVLYRPYWLMAHSRQGELLKDTMCAQHWSRSADGTLTAVTANPTIAVNEKLSRATLARYTSLTLDRGSPDQSLYSIATLIAGRP